ncbi:hypothetical protein BDY24DRAFT_32655 [Mrakia frigida]|uniref:uncharacterized protein n=1 Tax=Mrakia frigida TaxID=29902 RepID=UPI003FCBFCF0
MTLSREIKLRQERKQSRKRKGRSSPFAPSPSNHHHLSRPLLSLPSTLHQQQLQQMPKIDPVKDKAVNGIPRIFGFEGGTKFSVGSASRKLMELADLFDALSHPKPGGGVCDCDSSVVVSSLPLSLSPSSFFTFNLTVFAVLGQFRFPPSPPLPRSIPRLREGLRNRSSLHRHALQTRSTSLFRPPSSLSSTIASSLSRTTTDEEKCVVFRSSKAKPFLPPLPSSPLVPPRPSSPPPPPSNPTTTPSRRPLMLPTRGRKLILQPFLPSKPSLVKSREGVLLFSKSIELLLLQLQTSVLLFFPELCVEVLDEEESVSREGGEEKMKERKAISEKEARRRRWWATEMVSSKEGRSRKDERSESPGSEDDSHLQLLSFDFEDFRSTSSCRTKPRRESASGGWEGREGGREEEEGRTDNDRR